MYSITALLDKLKKETVLSRDEYLYLIRNHSEAAEYAAKLASDVRDGIYGKKIYIRGLIEFTNYCKNNCRYCGIRAQNEKAERYRLTPEEIISCADSGYELGFRTIVLQGGEDPYYSDELLFSIVSALKERHPDCALTLSVGERTRESYKMLKEAGTDRYLLRHETANREHYKMLHPDNMSWEHRIQCLKDLKELGYQTGAGFMVDSPGQTEEDLADELLFLKKIRPEMVGIGPFIPHKDTPFSSSPAGSADKTLFLLSLIRLTLPDVLLPATTALGTVDPMGREKGIESGANVLMPNLSPVNVRGKYLLYDNKICTGEEAAQCIECLKTRIKRTGYEIVTDRGDHIDRKEGNDI